MQTKNRKEKRVLCFACKKPIHIDELGGVKKINGKEAWFHNKVTCLITVEGSFPTPNPAPKDKKINYMVRIGLPHCFYCHKEHEHIGSCTPSTKENPAKITPCSKKCGKYYQLNPTPQDSPKEKKCNSNFIKEQKIDHLDCYHKNQTCEGCNPAPDKEVDKSFVEKLLKKLEKQAKMIGGKGYNFAIIDIRDFKSALAQQKQEVVSEIEKIIRKKRLMFFKNDIVSMVDLSDGYSLKIREQLRKEMLEDWNKLKSKLGK